MAEFEEVLKIIVKTQDETTAVVNKVDASLKTVEKQQHSLVRSQAALTKSSLGVADAFHMIIKRSPYVIGADFLARVLGARSLMSGFSDVLDKGAEATRNMARQMLGADIAGEKLEARIQSIRDNVKKLNEAIAVRDGVVNFGPNVKLGPYAPQIILPENIRSLEEAQVAILGAQAKLERLNETTHEGRERFLEQNDILRDLEQALIAMSDRTKAAADAQEKLKKKTVETKKAQAEWANKVWSGSGDLSPMLRAVGFGQDFAGKMIDAAKQGPELGAKVLQFFGAMKSGAEAAWPGVMAVASAFNEVSKRTSDNDAALASARDQLRDLSDPFKGQFPGESVTAKEDAIDRIFGKLKETRDLWMDIGDVVKWNVGSAIGAILTDIRSADEVMKNLLRSLIAGINNAIGQHISESLFAQIFPSAQGNVFSNGSIQKFAGGGVVNGPTMFPMRGGTGLMGEAGPEAIMPLRRGPGGRLGVEANGGGSRTVNFQLSVVAMDSRGVVEAILQPQVFSQITGKLAASISSGEDRNLVMSIRGARG